MKKNPNGGFDGVAILLEVVWRLGVDQGKSMFKLRTRSVEDGATTRDLEA